MVLRQEHITAISSPYGVPANALALSINPTKKPCDLLPTPMLVLYNPYGSQQQPSTNPYSTAQQLLEELNMDF